ncbi:hypothetical protein JCM11641_005993 [Rhodosporidiobolus odoratus]
MTSTASPGSAFSHSSVSSPFVSLSSLPLSPPHRPSLFSTSFYPTLASSSSWLARFALLQTLGEKDQDEEGGMGMWGGRGHTVFREAYGSTGCVNAMDWEEGGQERLATAGDDTKICIWKPGLDRPPKNGSTVVSPGLQYGLSEVIDTGHRANIFSVKWAPGMETRLFSCAGDATVRVYDLSLATNSSLSSATIIPSSGSRSAHQPWTHHEAASACTRVFRCHTDRVKRVATEASSDVLLSCGEDGTVRQHDLRTHHVCRTSRLGSQPNASCPPPLASYGGGMSLYSLSLSKLRPHLFVVAGTSPYAFLHDRRMLRSPAFQRDWSSPSLPYSPDSGSLTHCVRRFGVPSPTVPHDGDISNHIVATKLSPTKPNELLVSYSDRGVYLFDTDAETYVRPDSPFKEEKEGRKEGRGGGKAQPCRRDKHKRVVESGISEEEEEDEDARDEAKRLSALREETMGLSDEELEDITDSRHAVRRRHEMASGEEVGEAGAGDPIGIREGGTAHSTRLGADSSSSSATFDVVQQQPRRSLPLSTVAERFTAGESSEVGNDLEAAGEASEGVGRDDVEMAPSEGSEEDPEGLEERDTGAASSDSDEDEDASMAEDDESNSEVEESEEDEEEEEGDNPFIPGARARQHHPLVPMVAPKKDYVGHANNQTVKDINFAFDGSMVVSGSDDGTFFVWNKETSEVEAIFKGDSSVVNVLQPHPRLPILAISGIDETVKLFGPTTDKTASEKQNKVGQKAEIMARNARGEGRAQIGLSAQSILSLLAARLGDEGLTAGGNEHDEGGDSELAEDGGGRRRIRFVVNPGQEGQADCAVM